MPELLTQDAIDRFQDSLQNHPCKHDYTVMNLAFGNGAAETEFDPVLIGTAWMQELQTITPTARWLFWSVAGTLDKATNVAVLKPQTKTEANKLSRAYKELNQKGMMIRIKPAHYIINPTAVIPIHTYRTVLEQWAHHHLNS